MSVPLGVRFEAEIAEQPRCWRELAASAAPHALRAAVAQRPVVFLGSGSSFSVAEIAARAFRHSGTAAVALASTDVAFDRPPFEAATVVAFSQSGRSADVLGALDRFADARVVAVTNDDASPLATRADVVLELGVGPERAVPATKSVTTMLACAALAAASDVDAERAGLVTAAGDVERWLATSSVDIARVASIVGAATSVIVAGSGDGAIAAREVALKLKEAAYARSEGVAAGDFRHGGVALFDPSCALVLLADARDGAQAKLVDAAFRAGTAVVTIGEPGCDLAPGGGLLGQLVAGQCLALALGRRAGVDSDAPRGIGKVLG